MTNQIDILQLASHLPGWQEQIALDDLAESIETWTIQMNCTQPNAQVNYGKECD